MFVNLLRPRQNPLFPAQNILAVYRTIHLAYQKDHPDRIQSPVWSRPHIQSLHAIGHQPLILLPPLVLPHCPHPVLRPRPNRRDGTFSLLTPYNIFLGIATNSLLNIGPSLNQIFETDNYCSSFFK